LNFSNNNKFREIGIKTPEYFKALSMVDENGQERHGILVERIHDALIVKPDDSIESTGPGESLKDERITRSCPSLPINICKSPILKFGCWLNFSNKF
jgi:hypothetical protein